MKRSRSQLDGELLPQKVQQLLLELEAFKAQHGDYPTSKKPGVPGRELYMKRARLLEKKDLTTAQREDLQKTQGSQLDDVLNGPH